MLYVIVVGTKGGNEGQRLARARTYLYSKC